MKDSFDLKLMLEQLDLSPSERVVYMAGLGHSELSSAQLVRLSSLPKPTVMSAIKALRGYRLCTVKKRDGRSLLYQMQPLSAAKTVIGNKIRQLDELSQKIDQIETDSISSSHVQEAQGREEIKDFLEQALRCKSRRWQIIAPRDNALAYMPKEYIDYFKRTRVQNQIESETLWDEKWHSKQLSLNDVLTRKPRYVPKHLAKQIPCLLLAFDDKVLTLEGTTQPTAVLIQSQAAADTFKLIFEMAWRSQKT